MAELSPLHMTRKTASSGFPRCGLLAYHAAETPDEVLASATFSVTTAGGHLLCQVIVTLDCTKWSTG